MFLDHIVLIKYNPVSENLGGHMVVIGLAGGIGSGKSSVSHILEELGAVVFDADRVGHQIYLPGTDGWKAIVETFGDDVVAPDGQIDRKALGGKVFSDPAEMTKLNAIAWPRIKQKLADGIQEQLSAGAEVIVVDAAVMIEAGWTDLTDEVWVTTSPEAQVIKRIQARNNLTEDQIQARIASQMSTEERVSHADVVIENDGDLEDLQRKVSSLWQDRLVNS